MRQRSLVLLATLITAIAACETKRPPVVSPSPSPAPRATETPAPRTGTDPLPVTKAEGEVIVAAWSEPRQLPPGGGQAQVIVRLQRRGGAPYPGVEVRLATTSGALFSGGRVLVTDANGMTRDRLTTTGTARITVNAGGTVYRFDVPVS